MPDDQSGRQGGPGTPFPAGRDVPRFSDSYFLKTKEIVGHFGDKQATYAVFMRRPVLSATRLAEQWLRAIAEERGIELDIEVTFPESKWVGAGEPLMYVAGSLYHLVDLETLLLQKIGPACVAAYNAYSMCADLPHVAFLAMDARHCAGTEMAEMMAYAASVGSARAQRKHDATGFVGNATRETAHFFNQPDGLGTMPHGIVGYAGSTMRAAEMFHELFPEAPLTVLVDYYARELTDSLTVARRFAALASEGRLAVRLDTTGGRFIEGLDPSGSYAVLERNAPDAIRGYRSDVELRHLIGSGVSAAAIWRLREALDAEGFHRVKIVVSSGFTPEKCKVMAVARAPIDMIGTGSFLPERWSETYATADIIAYDGEPSVKVGREWLVRK